MLDHKYPLAIEEVQAIYTPVVQKLYRGNPLIEALPENCSEDDYIKKLTIKIPYDWEEEKDYPSYDRLDCTQQIYCFFQPWSIHIQLAQSVSQAIRSGYQGRNPLDPEEIVRLREIAGCVQDKDADFYRIKYINPHTPGFSVIGYSGTGKTSTMEHTLELFPQKIYHNNYKDIDWIYTQIVWMKLYCPFEGSVKDLCERFFSEFDRIMSDNTYVRFASKSTATTHLMIPQMAELARRHGLGILVIDEIQNLNAAKSNGIEKMMNFISDLINRIGVPVVLMGTEDAIDVINTKLMNVRRSLGQQGAIIMKLFEKGSDDWLLFIKRLWRYQWTTIRTPLTDELMDVLYENSSGLVFAVVWLFVEAQRAAIQLGGSDRPEIITPQLINVLANSDRFKILKAKLIEIGPKMRAGRSPFSKEDIKLKQFMETHVNIDKAFVQSLKRSEKGDTDIKQSRKSSLKGEIPDLGPYILKKGNAY